MHTFELRKFDGRQSLLLFARPIADICYCFVRGVGAKVIVPLRILHQEHGKMPFKHLLCVYEMNFEEIRHQKVCVQLIKTGYFHPSE